MKKIIVISIAALMLLTACGSKSEVQSESTLIPTPFTNYETIDDAIAAVGFEFIEPTALPDGYDRDAIMVYNDKSMVQINYKDDDDQIVYRVSKTLSSEELNGDYNKYKSTETIKVKDTDVTCLGEEKGDVGVAMWANGDYSYCIMADDDLDVDEVKNLVEPTL